MSGLHSDGGESFGKLAPCPYPDVLAGRCSSASQSSDIRCSVSAGGPAVSAGLPEKPCEVVA